MSDKAEAEELEALDERVVATELAETAETEAAAATEPKVVHAFAAGQEVELVDSPGARAKIVGQSVDEAGTPVYEVVYPVRAYLPESKLKVSE